MAYSKSLNDEIVRKWAETKVQDGPIFIDGACDENGYNSNKPGKKILFILKEAVGRTNDGQIDTSWIGKDQDKVMMSSYYKEWVLTGHKAYRYSFQAACQIWNDADYVKEGVEKCIEKLAFMNLSKYAGKPDSSDKTYLRYAEDHLDLLKQQFENLNPDIVVVATNEEGWTLFNKIYEYSALPMESKEDSNKKTIIIRKGNGKTFIFTPHPSIHKPFKPYIDLIGDYFKS